MRLPRPVRRALLRAFAVPLAWASARIDLSDYEARAESPQFHAARLWQESRTHRENIHTAIQFQRWKRGHYDHLDCDQFPMPLRGFIDYAWHHEDLRAPIRRAFGEPE